MPEPGLRGRAAGAGYALLGRALGLAAPWLLKRRLAKGREDPQRWREKLGEAGAARPEGRLIWLHAVGLGETLALRGLIAALAARDARAQFLVTSSTRVSAQVFAANLPARTRHQFLPLDAPRFVARFLDHWRPELAIWTEQDIWPGAVAAAQARGIPQALVAARITAASAAKRGRLASLYRAVFGALALVDAQDEGSAARLKTLGAEAVTVSGSLKPAAPVVVADAAVLADLRSALAGRRVWLAASTHAGDEAEALAALAQTPDPALLLIIAPRFVERADAIAEGLAAQGLAFARRSKAEVPGAEVRVWLADSFGEMGLWYRLAEVALIGGGFDAIGGHNPWEAVGLGVPVLHGPDVSNFASDYAALDGAGAARQVARGALAGAMPTPDEAAQMAARARELAEAARARTNALAARLLALMEAPPCP